MTFHAESSPSAAARVLIYGRDPVLLKTRQWVLERAGMCVTTVASYDAALRSLGENGIDAFVLCHTLPMDQRKNLKTIAAERWPTVKLLQLNKMVSHGIDHQEPGALNVADGPVALLQGIQHLVRQQGTPSLQ